MRWGDKLQAGVYGLYEAAATGNTGGGLSLFLQAAGGSPAAQTEGGVTRPALQVGLALVPRTGIDNQVPKAYLRMVFYDERNQYVDERIRYLPLGAGMFHLLQIPEQTIQQNGFVRIFVASESDAAVWFDELDIVHVESLVVQENHYDPWGLNLAGIETQGSPNHKYQYLNREKQDEFGLNWLDLEARMYDPQIGRFHVVDPLPDTETQESLSPYQYAWNNPVNKSDPDGKCPNCVTAGIGALVGGLIGGGVEAVSQIVEHGEVTDWGAVGGSALQGAITGGAAGFTGGASLAVTTTVSVGANVAGGVANRAVQGKETTAKDIAVDAAAGVAAGAGGKLLDKAVQTVRLKEAAKISGILRDASTGKGNYGLGTATSKQADKAGKAWVGKGATTASDGKTLISADKLRQYRPPSPKKSSYATTGKQANFESRYVKPDGKTISQWQGNGHLNVQKPWYQFW